MQPDQLTEKERLWLAVKFAICALILLAMVAIHGCASWKTNSARTLRALNESAVATEKLTIARCGYGGAKAATKCKTESDKKCTEFDMCHKVTKAVHSALVAVLVAKLVLQAATDDDRSKVEAVMIAAIKAFVPVKQAIQSWVK